MKASDRVVGRGSLLKILIDDESPATVYLGSEEDGTVVNLSDGMPLRVALMGRRKGDVVKYDSPKGRKTARITEVIA